MREPICFQANRDANGFLNARGNHFFILPLYHQLNDLQSSIPAIRQTSVSVVPIDFPFLAIRLDL